jgi:pimeloyl-ACP methyl ester carboxylesterase
MKTQRFAGSGGVTLAADVGGDPHAPPVILMHGGGQTRWSWGRAARDLVAAGYHVISLDLRGHGESDWAAGYEIEHFVADLRAVVDTLAVPPALVGASLGGLTGLLALGETPLLDARALVLVDVTPRMEVQGIERIREFMSANPHGFASLDEVAEAVARYITHRPRPKDPQGLRKNVRLREDGRFYWHWDPRFIEDIDQQRRVAPAERLREAARNVRVPTLLVRGRLSEIVSDAGVEELRTLVPHCAVAEVHDAGHMVAGDRNDVFNAAVERFLAATVPAGQSPNTPNELAG